MATFVFDAYGTLFDVQSVANEVEAAFPGRGETVTQIWRLKQLEYTWLRAAMGSYADFRQVTEEALRFALVALDIDADAVLLDRLAGSYERLAPYPDTVPALAALAGHTRAIFSNGSPAMLDAVVAASGLGRHLEAVISVDAARTYKPDPAAYALVPKALDIDPSQVIFVSGNGFDVCGAKAFGFRVVRIERPGSSTSANAAAGAFGPTAMFRALRMRRETFGGQADRLIAALTELPALAGLTDGVA